VIAAVQRWAAEHGGRPPIAADWSGRRDASYPHENTVARVFGTWAAGIEAAGFRVNHGGGPPAAFTQEEIVGAIKRWVAEYDRVPSQMDWTPALARHYGKHDLADRWYAGDWPSARQATDAFGGWTAALAAAGFTPNRTGPRA